MPVPALQLHVGDLAVEVVRKAIKHVHLAVLPPDGRVRIATPLHVSDEQVRRTVIERLGWIRAQQAKYTAQPRQTVRQYVTGETHYYRGRGYRLRLREADAPAGVKLAGSFIELQVRPGTTAAQRADVLQAWYRARLKEQLPPLLVKWEATMGVKAADWGVKLMKTKWGTCNIEAQRIWLNLELAKVAPALLEYLVVHQLTHLLERAHNDRFRALLDLHLPQWRTYRDELNSSTLAAYEDYGDA